MKDSLTLVEAPEDTLPVSLDEFKTAARISTTTQNDLLLMYLRSAFAKLDGPTGWLNRALLTQTWKWRMDTWPCDDIFEVPLAPLQSVSHIKYVNELGTLTTWASDQYQVDIYSKPARIAIIPNVSFPTLRGVGYINQVEIQIVVGYGNNADDVPENIKHAGILIASHFYEHRLPFELIAGVSLVQMPETVHSLILPYEVKRFGR